MHCFSAKQPQRSAGMEKSSDVVRELYTSSYDLACKSKEAKHYTVCQQRDGSKPRGTLVLEQRAHTAAQTVAPASPQRSSAPLRNAMLPHRERLLPAARRAALLPRHSTQSPLLRGRRAVSRSWPAARAPNPAPPAPF